MDIRTHTEFDTYAFATTPFKFFGLSNEDILFIIIPLVLGMEMTDLPLVGIISSIVGLWGFRVVSDGQPDGYLVLIVSNVLNMIATGKIGANIPVLAQIFRPLANGVNRMWIKCGLIPSFHLENKYER